MKKYTLDVLTDETTGEKYIELPLCEIEALGWTPGTQLQWIDNFDGTFTLRKKQMDFVQKVLQFNKIAGNGEEFSPRMTALYFGLIMEELAETVNALPDSIAFEHMVKTLNHWSLRFKEGDFDKLVENIDHVEALDGFVDIAVVALGGAAALGANVDGACHEVADSNLSKTVEIDGVVQFIKDENGKVTKPSTYWKPNLTKYVKK